MEAVTHPGNLEGYFDNSRYTAASYPLVRATQLVPFPTFLLIYSLTFSGFFFSPFGSGILSLYSGYIRRSS